MSRSDAMLDSGRQESAERAANCYLLSPGTLLALLIVAPPQIVALIRRQIFKAIPLFAEVLFVLRRKILPALVVALNILFLFGTETAPIVAAILCPSIGGQQQD